MAEVLPNSRRDTIEFFRVHLPDWEKDPSAIGLSPALVAALSARVAAADAARAAADTAASAARSATAAFHQEADAMRRLGADLLKTIKAYAATEDDPGVYATARVPPPARGGPGRPPERPIEPRASVNGLGHIRLAWKGARKGGVQFLIERRMTPLAGPPGPWAFVGLSAAGRFTDRSVPRGFASAAYIVTAVSHAGRSAPSTTALVAFGSHPGDAAAAAEGRPPGVRAA